MDTFRVFLESAPAPSLRAASPYLAETSPLGEACTPHPIQAVCEQVFDARVSDAEGFARAKALIRAGADLFHRDPVTLDGLVTIAIRLSAPSLAHALLDAGAPHDVKGRSGARPLHWAAIMGMPDLLERFLPGADLAERDSKLGSTPLGWALEGWASPPKGSHGGQIVCASALVEAGAIVEAPWRESARVKQDCALRAALRI
ncbi:ankyrin repeat domain-containing protein [Maricaulaceae bacterium MS644]